MRLLDTISLKLREFLGHNVPPYAILSHTWGEGEISFQEMGGGRAPLERKAGFEKIKGACALAGKDGFRHIWIDTCCIDKTSSSELSEAINSMFRWYQDSAICYAYLSDVSSTGPSPTTWLLFKSSRWFKRGWTLQELIAPNHLSFYSSTWDELGTKCTLQGIVADITGIQQRVLSQKCPDLESFSIAQRMSWAALRETTREEDRAYSLMGIFNINMPCYMAKEKEPLSGFRNSPKAFQESGNIIRIQNKHAKPFAFTNRGISLELPVFNLNRETIEKPALSVALLDCQDEELEKGSRLGLIVETLKIYDRLPVERKFCSQFYAFNITEEQSQRQTIFFSAVHKQRSVRPCRLLQQTIVVDLEQMEYRGFRIAKSFPTNIVQDGGNIVFKYSDYDLHEMSRVAVQFVDGKDKSFILFVFHDYEQVKVRVDGIPWQNIDDPKHSCWQEASDSLQWHSTEGIKWGIKVAPRPLLVNGQRCYHVRLDMAESGTPEPMHNDLTIMLIEKVKLEDRRTRLQRWFGSMIDGSMDAEKEIEQVTSSLFEITDVAGFKNEAEWGSDEAVVNLDYKDEHRSEGQTINTTEAPLQVENAKGYKTPRESAESLRHQILIRLISLSNFYRERPKSEM